MISTPPSPPWPPHHPNTYAHPSVLVCRLVVKGELVATGLVHPISPWLLVSSAMPAAAFEMASQCLPGVLPAACPSAQLPRFTSAFYFVSSPPKRSNGPRRVAQSEAATFIRPRRPLPICVPARRCIVPQNRTRFPLLHPKHLTPPTPLTDKGPRGLGHIDSRSNASSSTAVRERHK